MAHSQEAAGRFFVACGQAAKLLEAAEKTFDFGAVAVQVGINTPGHFPVLFTDNDDSRAQRLDGCHHGVGVIDFIGQYISSPCQLGGAAAIRLRAGPEHHPQRIAQYLDQHVQPGGQPAPTAAEGFVADAAFFSAARRLRVDPYDGQIKRDSVRTGFLYGFN